MSDIVVSYYIKPDDEQYINLIIYFAYNNQIQLQLDLEEEAIPLRDKLNQAIKEAQKVFENE